MVDKERMKAGMGEKNGQRGDGERKGGAMGLKNDQYEGGSSATQSRRPEPVTARIR
jgi:hypothetical protein